jgi:hypothetical protein
MGAIEITSSATDINIEKLPDCFKAGSVRGHVERVFL